VGIALLITGCVLSSPLLEKTGVFCSRLVNHVAPAPGTKCGYSLSTYPRRYGCQNRGRRCRSRTPRRSQRAFAVPDRRAVSWARLHLVLAAREYAAVQILLEPLSSGTLVCV